MSLHSVFRRSSHVLKPSIQRIVSNFCQSVGATSAKITYSRCAKQFLGKKSFRTCFCNTQQHIFLTSQGRYIQSRLYSADGLADQVLKAKIQSETKDEKSNVAQTVEPNKQSEEDQEKIKQQQNSVRAVKFTLYAFGTIFVGAMFYVFLVWGAPIEDQKGNPLKDEFSELPIVEQYIKRSISELRNYKTFLANPSRDRLLPDPLKHPYIQPPFTLLIELTGVLVHPDWTYKTGWRFKKRPGIDYFLNQLAKGYRFEVVVYTAELGFTAYPIIDALDSQGIIMYRLFRDSTKYENGVHSKDIGKVNRDLSKVIMIDCDEKAVEEYRNNSIVLPRWKGNDDDRVLFDLAALLQTISTSELEDVRGVLEYYSKYEDPIAEFREKQKKLVEFESSNKDLQKIVESKANPLGPAFNWMLGHFKANK